jgi:hypothetical protein
MYLRTLTINLFSGPFGNLLVTGRWDNSPMHGNYDPQGVVKELLDDMFFQLRADKRRGE